MSPAVVEAELSAAAVPAAITPEAPALSARDKLIAAMSSTGPSAVPVEPAVVEPPVVAALEAVADEEFQLPGIDDEVPPAADAPVVESDATAPTDPDREIGALLATPRGKRIYAAHKTMQELAKLPDEGGIGFAPSVQDIKESYEAQLDWRAIQKDFSAPEPESRARFLEFWLAPDANGRIRPGAEQVVEMLPAYLNDRNPQVFQRLARPMYEGLATRFMELSKLSADPAEQVKLAEVADYISRDQLGRPLVQPAGGAPQSPQLPPDVARELEELRNFRASQQQQRQTQAQQQQSAFSNDIDARCDEQLAADVEVALAPAKGIKEANPFVYNATKNQMIADLKSHLSRNTSGMNRVEFAKSRAVNSRDPQQAGQVIQERRRLYIEPLRQLRGSALKALGVTLTTQAAATADQRNLSAGRTAPAATMSTPVQPTSTLDPKLQPGESNRNRLDRLMSAGR